MSESNIWGANTPETPKAVNVISVADLKTAISTAGTAHMEIDLCYSGRKAKIKPLKTEDKKELLKSMETKNETLVNKAFDNIIAKYVEFSDGATPENIVSQERYQILAYIRIANGDQNADIMHVCPECEHAETSISYDLEQIYVKPFKKIDNVIKIDYPNGLLMELLVEPLTRSEEKSVELFIHREGDSIANKQFGYLAACVKKAKLVTPEHQEQQVDLSTLEKKIELYNSFDGSVESKIADIAREYSEGGVKMPLQFRCSKCKYESNEEVNLSVFFIS
jgi:hypothetical protein